MGIALMSTPEQQAITDTVVPASRPLVFLRSAAALGLLAASWHTGHYACR
jgi:hypothetical protein